jgi:hypothetical protein
MTAWFSTSAAHTQHRDSQGHLYCKQNRCPVYSSGQFKTFRGPRSLKFCPPKCGSIRGQPGQCTSAPKGFFEVIQVYLYTWCVEEVQRMSLSAPKDADLNMAIDPQARAGKSTSTFSCSMHWTFLHNFIFALIMQLTSCARTGLFLKRILGSDSSTIGWASRSSGWPILYLLSLSMHYVNFWFLNSKSLQYSAKIGRSAPQYHDAACRSTQSPTKGGIITAKDRLFT